MRTLLLCLTTLLPIACSGSEGATNTGSGGTPASGTGGASSAEDTAVGGEATTGTGGTAATNGGGSSNSGVGGAFTLGDCGLPTVGTAGVPKPSGTPGNFTVLNWAGFQGAVTYTFDDATSSQIAHYAELQALGVRMTFYLTTSAGTMTDPTWVQAVKDGHELGNHTKTHPETATDAELDEATAFIQTKFGVTPYTMAAPYGNSSYQTPAKTRFLINRGVSNGLIAPNDANDATTAFNLPCFIPAASAPASALNAQIDSALAAGKWRVLLVHGFTGGTDGAYLPVAIEEFVAAVNYAKGLGSMWIDSMVNVGAYWRGQAALSKVTPVTSGTDTTWTWTLPANFPPNKCLRVKVDGGTLTQAGTALTWNDHGYYEIYLDAGSVTLSQ